MAKLLPGNRRRRRTVRYSASLGYTDDEGVALSTGYDRVNFKSNLDARITKQLTASFGVDFARTNNRSLCQPAQHHLPGAGQSADR